MPEPATVDKSGLRSITTLRGDVFNKGVADTPCGYRLGITFRQGEVGI